MLADENIFLLDVRRAAELKETGFINGAYNIAHTQLYNYLDELPNNKKIVVQCHSGERSRYAASFLETRGFETANVLGGIIKWIKNGERIEMQQSEAVKSSP